MNKKATNIIKALGCVPVSASEFYSVVGRMDVIIDLSGERYRQDIGDYVGRWIRRRDGALVGISGGGAHGLTDPGPAGEE